MTQVRKQDTHLGNISPFCSRLHESLDCAIAWHGEMMSAFISFLKSSGRASILAEFNLENARQFMINEQNRKVSPYTAESTLIKGIQFLAIC